jgi:hypothetical protein
MRGQVAVEPMAAVAPAARIVAVITRLPSEEDEEAVGVVAETGRDLDDGSIKRSCFRTA